jgi:hypothetical protein
VPKKKTTLGSKKGNVSVDVDTRTPAERFFGMVQAATNLNTQQQLNFVLSAFKDNFIHHYCKSVEIFQGVYTDSKGSAYWRGWFDKSSLNLVEIAHLLAIHAAADYADDHDDYEVTQNRIAKDQTEYPVDPPPLTPSKFYEYRWKIVLSVLTEAAKMSKPGDVLTFKGNIDALEKVNIDASIANAWVGDYNSLKMFIEVRLRPSDALKWFAASPERAEQLPESLHVWWASQFTRESHENANVESQEEKYNVAPQEIDVQKQLQKTNNAIDIQHRNAFIHDGDAWVIWFQGTKLKPIKEMDGMIYIANLLKNPGKPMHVTDLCAFANRRRNDAMMTNENLADSLKNGDMFISTMQDDGLDDQAKDELWKKIQDLDEKRKNPILVESVRVNAENERAKLIKIANDLYGKKSLHRLGPNKVNECVKDDLDRARRAIERTREKIQEQSPKLAEYLKTNIKRGTEYSFIDQVIHWHISE